jgi:hypothetical protein
MTKVLRCFYPLYLRSWFAVFGFDRDASDEVEVIGLTELLQRTGYKTKLPNNQSPPTWLVGKNWFLKLVNKEGNESRLGAALFVLRK